MLRPSSNHGTQRLPNDDDDDGVMLVVRNWLINMRYIPWQSVDVYVHFSNVAELLLTVMISGFL